MSSSSTEVDLLNRAIPRTDDGDDSDSDDENTISFDSIIGELNGGKSLKWLIMVVTKSATTPLSRLTDYRKQVTRMLEHFVLLSLIR